MDVVPICNFIECGDIQIRIIVKMKKKSLSSPSTVIKMLTSLSLISANNGSTLETLDLITMLYYNTIIVYYASLHYIMLLYISQNYLNLRK